MEDFKYIRELFTSMREVLSKPALLMPFVYMFIFTMAFLFFTPSLPGFEKNVVPEPTTLLSKVILTGVYIAVFLLFYGMGLIRLRKYFMKEEAAGLVNKEGSKIFGKLFLQNIYLFMIFGLPFIAIFIVGELINKLPDANIGIWLKLILYLAYLIYFIAVSLFYLFSPAIIAYEGKRPIVSLQESHSLFKKDVHHFVLTFFSFLLFGAIMLIPISIGAALLSFVVQSGTLAFYLLVFFIFVVMLFIIPAVTLYRFKAYQYGLNYVNAISDDSAPEPAVTNPGKTQASSLQASSSVAAPLTAVLDKKSDKKSEPQKTEPKAEMQIQQVQTKELSVIPEEKTLPVLAAESTQKQEIKSQENKVIPKADSKPLTPTVSTPVKKESAPLPKMAAASEKATAKPSTAIKSAVVSAKPATASAKAVKPAQKSASKSAPVNSAVKNSAKPKEAPKSVVKSVVKQNMAKPLQKFPTTKSAKAKKK
jgi:hypothetical protein